MSQQSSKISKRIIVVTVAVVAGLFITAKGVNAATPNDPLYFLDTALENIQLALTSDPASKYELEKALLEERLVEFEQENENGEDTDKSSDEVGDAYNRLLGEFENELDNDDDFQSLEELYKKQLKEELYDLEADKEAAETEEEKQEIEDLQTEVEDEIEYLDDDESDDTSSDNDSNDSDDAEDEVDEIEPSETPEITEIEGQEDDENEEDTD